MFSRSNIATVKQVQSADTFLLKTKATSSEIYISLSNINVPKLGSAKDTEREEPFAHEARDYIRKLLIGKEVKYLVEYSTVSGRDFGSLQIQKPVNDETDIARILVKNGFATVRRSDKNQSSDEFIILSALEDEATVLRKGIHSLYQRLSRTVNYATPVDPQTFFKTYSMKSIPGVIEQVRDGSTYRICLVIEMEEKPLYQYITFALSGLKCPQFRKDIPNIQDLIEPFGEEAKKFVEIRLLQKDIHVILEGLTNNTFLGTVVFPQGDISQLLLNEGYAKIQEWNLSMCTNGAAKLRLAEQSAKDKRLRIWKEFVPAPVIKVQVQEAIVLRILQADTILLQMEDKTEKRLTLSSIRSSKGKEEKDIFYSNEAKEYLRQKLVGKKVHFTVDFIKPAQDEYDEKECGTIKLGNQNIGESMVSKGFCTVLRHKKEDLHRSVCYVQLLAAEEKARNEAKGLHSEKVVTIQRIFDASETLTKAKQALTSLQRGGDKHAIVEYCSGASRFKLLIPSQNTKLAFIIACIRVPRTARLSDKGEPFGSEALSFANSVLSQRDVIINIHSIDKTGSFIGDLFVTSSTNERSNFALLLLEKGFAFVHDMSAQNSIHSRVFYETQDKAKAIKVGVWSIESNHSRVMDDNEDRPIPQLMDATVTELSEKGF